MHHQFLGFQISHNNFRDHLAVEMAGLLNRLVASISAFSEILTYRPINVCNKLLWFCLLPTDYYQLSPIFSQMLQSKIFLTTRKNLKRSRIGHLQIYRTTYTRIALSS